MSADQNPHPFVSPDRVLISITRWMETALQQGEPIPPEQVKIWHDSLVRAREIQVAQNEAAVMANQTRFRVTSANPISAAHASRTKNLAAWNVAELASDANKFADAQRSRELEVMAQDVLLALELLTIGVARQDDTPQIAEPDFPIGA